MKKIVVFILILSIVFLVGISGCGKPNDPEIQENKTLIQDCKANGGLWWFNDHCINATKDFGKGCNDSDECEGGCLSTIELLRGEMNYTSPGECSQYKEVLGGCHSFVEDGKATGEICID